MSAETSIPKRRDLIEGHLGRCVSQHEEIRKALQKIDQAGPGMQRLTCDVRACLTTLATIYHAIRLEMTVDAMVGGGEFDAPSGQRPVSELALFAAGELQVTDEDGAKLVGMLPGHKVRDERDRFKRELEAIADDTLVDDSEEGRAAA